MPHVLDMSQRSLRAGHRPITKSGSFVILTSEEIQQKGEMGTVMKSSILFPSPSASTFTTASGAICTTPKRNGATLDEHVRLEGEEDEIEMEPMTPKWSAVDEDEKKKPKNKWGLLSLTKKPFRRAEKHLSMGSNNGVVSGRSPAPAAPFVSPLFGNRDGDANAVDHGGEGKPTPWRSAASIKDMDSELDRPPKRSTEGWMLAGGEAGVVFLARQCASCAVAARRRVAMHRAQLRQRKKWLQRFATVDLAGGLSTTYFRRYCLPRVPLLPPPCFLHVLDEKETKERGSQPSRVTSDDPLGLHQRTQETTAVGTVAEHEDHDACLLPGVGDLSPTKGDKVKRFTSPTSQTKDGGGGDTGRSAAPLPFSPHSPSISSSLVSSSRLFSSKVKDREETSLASIPLSASPTTTTTAKTTASPSAVECTDVISAIREYHPNRLTFQLVASATAAMAAAVVSSSLEEHTKPSGLSTFGKPEEGKEMHKMGVLTSREITGGTLNVPPPPPAPRATSASSPAARAGGGAKTSVMVSSTAAATTKATPAGTELPLEEATLWASLFHQEYLRLQACRKRLLDTAHALAGVHIPGRTTASEEAKEKQIPEKKEGGRDFVQPQERTPVTTPMETKGQKDTVVPKVDHEGGQTDSMTKEKNTKDSEKKSSVEWMNGIAVYHRPLKRKKKGRHVSVTITSLNSPTLPLSGEEEEGVDALNLAAALKEAQKMDSTENVEGAVEEEEEPLHSRASGEIAGGVEGSTVSPLPRQSSIQSSSFSTHSFPSKTFSASPVPTLAVGETAIPRGTLTTPPLPFPTSTPTTNAESPMHSLTTITTSGQPSSRGWVFSAPPPLLAMPPVASSSSSSSSSKEGMTWKAMDGGGGTPLGSVEWSSSAWWTSFFECISHAGWSTGNPLTPEMCRMWSKLFRDGEEMADALRKAYLEAVSLALEHFPLQTQPPFSPLPATLRLLFHTNLSSSAFMTPPPAPLPPSMPPTLPAPPLRRAIPPLHPPPFLWTGSMEGVSAPSLSHNSVGALSVSNGSFPSSSAAAAAAATPAASPSSLFFFTLEPTSVVIPLSLPSPPREDKEGRPVRPPVLPPTPPPPPQSSPTPVANDSVGAFPSTTTMAVISIPPPQPMSRVGLVPSWWAAQWHRWHYQEENWHGDHNGERENVLVYRMSERLATQKIQKEETQEEDAPLESATVLGGKSEENRMETANEADASEKKEKEKKKKNKKKKDEKQKRVGSTELPPSASSSALFPCFSPSIGRALFDSDDERTAIHGTGDDKMSPSPSYDKSSHRTRHARSYASFSHSSSSSFFSELITDEDDQHDEAEEDYGSRDVGQRASGRFNVDPLAYDAEEEKETVAWEDGATTYGSFFPSSSHAVDPHPGPSIRDVSFTLEPFLCQHGETVLDSSWLDPDAAFWQEIGPRRAALWFLSAVCTRFSRLPPSSSSLSPSELCSPFSAFSTPMSFTGKEKPSFTSVNGETTTTSTTTTTTTTTMLHGRGDAPPSPTTTEETSIKTATTEVSGVHPGAAAAPCSPGECHAATEPEKPVVDVLTTSASVAEAAANALLYRVSGVRSTTLTSSLVKVLPFSASTITSKKGEEHEVLSDAREEPMPQRYWRLQLTHEATLLRRFRGNLNSFFYPPLVMVHEEEYRVFLLRYAPSLVQRVLPTVPLSSSSIPLVTTAPPTSSSMSSSMEEGGEKKKELDLVPWAGEEEIPHSKASPKRGGDGRGGAPLWESAASPLSPLFGTGPGNSMASGFVLSSGIPPLSSSSTSFSPGTSSRLGVTLSSVSPEGLSPRSSHKPHAMPLEAREVSPSRNAHRLEKGKKKSHKKKKNDEGEEAEEMDGGTAPRRSSFRYRTGGSSMLQSSTFFAGLPSPSAETAVDDSTPHASTNRKRSRRTHHLSLLDPSLPSLMAEMDPEDVEGHPPPVILWDQLLHCQFLYVPPSESQAVPQGSDTTTSTSIATTGNTRTTRRHRPMIVPLLSRPTCLMCQEALLLHFHHRIMFFTAETPVFFSLYLCIQGRGKHQPFLLPKMYSTDCRLGPWEETGNDPASRSSVTFLTTLSELKEKIAEFIESSHHISCPSFSLTIQRASGGAAGPASIHKKPLRVCHPPYEEGVSEAQLAKKIRTSVQKKSPQHSSRRGTTKKMSTKGFGDTSLKIQSPTSTEVKTEPTTTLLIVEEEDEDEKDDDDENSLNDSKKGEIATSPSSPFSPVGKLLPYSDDRTLYELGIRDGDMFVISTSSASASTGVDSTLLLHSHPPLPHAGSKAGTYSTGSSGSSGSTYSHPPKSTSVGGTAPISGISQRGPLATSSLAPSRDAGKGTSGAAGTGWYTSVTPNSSSISSASVRAMGSASSSSLRPTSSRNGHYPSTVRPQRLGPPSNLCPSSLLCTHPEGGGSPGEDTSTPLLAHGNHPLQESTNNSLSFGSAMGFQDMDDGGSPLSTVGLSGTTAAGPGKRSGGESFPSAGKYTGPPNMETSTVTTTTHGTLSSSSRFAPSNGGAVVWQHTPAGATPLATPPSYTHRPTLSPASLIVPAGAMEINVESISNPSGMATKTPMSPPRQQYQQAMKRKMEPSVDSHVHGVMNGEGTSGGTACHAGAMAEDKGSHSIATLSGTTSPSTMGTCIPPASHRTLRATSSMSTQPPLTPTSTIKGSRLAVPTGSSSITTRPSSRSGNRPSSGRRWSSMTRRDSFSAAPPRLSTSIGEKGNPSSTSISTLANTPDGGSFNENGTHFGPTLASGGGPPAATTRPPPAPPTSRAGGTHATREVDGNEGGPRLAADTGLVPRDYGDDEDEGVGLACPVCTFLNAPGMVSCEMCETPLH